MTDPRRSTPSEATILRAWARELKSEIRVGLVGTVTAYDHETRLATVQPVMLEQDGETVPPLRGVRIGALRAGPFVVSLPVAVGDTVEVRFLDVSHDAFISDGVKGQAPDATRRHALSDAVALPLALGPEAIPASSSSSLVIGTADGSGTVEVDPSGNVVVTSGDIRLGSTSATDPVVLLGEIVSYLQALRGALATGSNASGPVVWATPIPDPSTMTGASMVIAQ